MRNYFWLVTWFYPKGGHDSDFMKEQKEKHGKLHCKFRGVNQCKKKALVIQRGVSYLCKSIIYKNRV